ncbi:MAG: tetratricopeptide repeat protein [Verrucomicrobia bacterium]|nr:tetratricopeptide repeat protein [Verrucomicrobiota bacterium]
MSRFGNLEFESPEQFGATEPREERDAAYWMTSGESAFAGADFDLALRHFSRVLEHDPMVVGAWAGQVRSLMELGEFREARVWADKALERFATAPELLAAKGAALGRLGDLDTAIAFSDASLEERGDTPYVWLARGDVLLARRERRAEYCFERACAMAPDQWLVAWLAGRIRQVHGQFAAALTLARRAAAMAPDRWVVWMLCGECQRGLGLTDHALVSFQQVLDLNPDCRAAADRVTELRQRGPMDRLAGRLRRWFCA